VAEFVLDPRITASSHGIAALDLCDLRLQDDSRFPWVVLSPRRVGAVELADLSYGDQCRLLVEIDLAGRLVRALGEAWSRPVQKLNIANLGNVTPQLHWHIVGRRSDDPCWPGPVWGQGAPEPLVSEIVDNARTICVEIGKQG
jgi:diadenosine tetraphosphate (Ap4A) HIT family hydrolase